MRSSESANQTARRGAGGGGESPRRPAAPGAGAGAAARRNGRPGDGLAHPAVEAGGRLDGRGEEQELVGEGREPLDPGPAPGAAVEVGQRPGAVLAVGDAERDLGGDLSQVLAVGGRHLPPSSPRPADVSSPFERSAATSFWVAVLIRVLAVPTGIASISPISRAVKPNSAASSRARRWSAGSAPSESRSSRVPESGDRVRRRRPHRALGVADRVRVQRLGALRPQVVDREVAGDREQPGGDPPAARVVGAGVAPRAHEGLLCDLLRDRGVADHAHGEPVHARLEPPHECGRGLRVPGGEPGDQRFIGRGPDHTSGCTGRRARRIARCFQSRRRAHPYRGVKGKLPQEVIRAPKAPRPLRDRHPARLRRLWRRRQRHHQRGERHELDRDVDDRRVVGGGRDDRHLRDRVQARPVGPDDGRRDGDLQPLQRR